MTDNILYGLERSVYTRIARLALEEKGVPYTLQEVEIFGPEGVPPEHLQRQPFGRIPVLDAGGFMLYETSAITRYVDEAFPGRLLQPRTPQQRARMNQVIGLLDAYGYRPMVWDVFVQRVRIPLQGGVADEDRVAHGLRDAAKCLQALEDVVTPEPYLVGDMLSLADLHAYPMLRYLALAPEGQALLQAQHPRLWAWLEMMSQRASVQRTRGRFEQVCPTTGSQG